MPVKVTIPLRVIVSLTIFAGLAAKEIAIFPVPSIIASSAVPGTLAPLEPPDAPDQLDVAPHVAPDAPTQYLCAAKPLNPLPKSIINIKRLKQIFLCEALEKLNCRVVKNVFINLVFGKIKNDYIFRNEDAKRNSMQTLVGIQRGKLHKFWRRND